MATLFKHFPATANSTHCSDAHFILCNAHDAASSFLDTFEKVRRARKAKGTPTDEEQDLLRAMLLFATAGLDSMVKQLITDALPSVIEIDIGATEMFKQHVERRSEKDDRLDRRFLADIIADANPRKRLLENLVDDLTSKSLQSTEQLLRAAAFFNIPSASICDNPRNLTTIFNARNQIAHEMDVDFAQPNRSRRPRAKATMTSFANEIFKIADSFLGEVDRKFPTVP
jgi:hypothetical protein